MFKETYSDLWLREKDINIDLKSKLDNNINPLAAVRILNAVKKIVNIVHGKNKYEVIFNGQEDSAYINYSKKIIVISSQLLKNKNSKYSIYDIIDIETGLALHESGHAEHTPDPTSEKYKEIYKAKLNSNIKCHLHNIIEDVIMEKIVSNDFPGYEAYFIKLRNHYFKKASIEVTENNNSNRINEFLLGLRYTGKAILFDPLAIKAVDLINDLLNIPNNELINIDRLELTEKIYNLIIIPEKNTNDSNDNDSNDNDSNDNSLNGNGLDGNSLDDDDNDSNLSSSDNKDFDLNDDEIGGELSDFIKKETIDKNSKLNSSEKILIQNMIEQEFDENIGETEYGKKYEVITCKPKVTSDGILNYKHSLKDVNKLIVRFRNKFSDANTIYRQNSYGLSKGNLDEDSLYSAKYNRNIFMNNTVISNSRTKNIDIAFTIDCSGSMFALLDSSTNKKRYEVARDLSVLFTEALAPINSINTWVFGFQTSLDYISSQFGKNNNPSNVRRNLSDEQRYKLNSSTQLITLYSPNSKTKHAIGSLCCGGSTPEYEGLSETINVLKKQGRKDSKKIVVMLTDGDPTSSVFGYNEQKRLILDKINECEKKGITVIHLALTSEAEKTPYKNKIKWKSQSGYDGLVDSFIKMLQKQIS